MQAFSGRGGASSGALARWRAAATVTVSSPHLPRRRTVRMALERGPELRHPHHHGCFSRWVMTVGGVAGQRARFSTSRTELTVRAHSSTAARPSRDSPESAARQRPSVRRMSSTRSSESSRRSGGGASPSRSAVALGKLAALARLVDLGQAAAGEHPLHQRDRALLVPQQEPLDLAVLEQRDLLPQRVQADRVAVVRGDESRVRQAQPRVAEQRPDDARRRIETERGELWLDGRGRTRLPHLDPQRVQLSSRTAGDAWRPRAGRSPSPSGRSGGRGGQPRSPEEARSLPRPPGAGGSPAATLRAGPSASPVRRRSWRRRRGRARTRPAA